MARRNLTPYLSAIATLRRCQQALVDPTVTADERARVAELADATLQTLEASAHRRHLATSALASRVAVLERQLADRTAGERRRIVCERLGISRSRYYELRAHSPETSGLATARILSR